MELIFLVSRGLSLECLLWKLISISYTIYLTLFFSEDSLIVVGNV